MGQRALSFRHRHGRDVLDRGCGVISHWLSVVSAIAWESVIHCQAKLACVRRARFAEKSLGRRAARQARRGQPATSIGAASRRISPHMCLASAATKGSQDDGGSQETNDHQDYRRNLSIAADGGRSPRLWVINAKTRPTTKRPRGGPSISSSLSIDV